MLIGDEVVDLFTMGLRFVGSRFVKLAKKAKPRCGDVMEQTP